MNRYDEFGAPHANNLGRFGFTGQMYMENLGLHHYKARAYHSGLGRFLQTDPIGYGDGMNMYAYVGNDPVNNVDPSGMSRISRAHTFCYGNCGSGYANTPSRPRRIGTVILAMSAEAAAAGGALALSVFNPGPATRLITATALS